MITPTKVCLDFVFWYTYHARSIPDTLEDHMTKSSLMAPKWMREWGQRRSSTAISRMVRQPATNCPKDCQTTATSLQVRLQPSVWHWTITNTKETLNQDIDPLACVHYTDMKPRVNSYIQKLVQTKWDVAVHGRDLYLVKPTLGPPKKFQHLTRAEEVGITRLRIGHTKATKSHILSRGPPTGCHHCGQTLTIDHMLLDCALLQECRDEYHSRIVECSLRDNSRDLHSGIPARSGILLSDIMKSVNFN